MRVRRESRPHRAAHLLERDIVYPFRNSHQEVVEPRWGRSLTVAPPRRRCLFSIPSEPRQTVTVMEPTFTCIFQQAPSVLSHK